MSLLRLSTVLSTVLLAGTAVAGINPAVRRQETTAAATTTASSKPSVAFSSVTGCHLHGSDQYCMADATEYKVVAEATATATEDLPSSYTDCHNHGTATYCMSPSGGEVQLLGEDETVPTTTASEAADMSSVTAVSDCHMHDSSVFCVNGDNEYYVQTTMTATSELPAEFTGCHSHGEEIYCMTEDDEVQIIAAENIESGNADPDEQHCHFHAGVEHCVGAGESEGETQNCDRTDRDYNISLRIGILFVVLVASAIGVFGPILLSSFVSVRSNIFLIILKQFGTGVIISTAFVHLFTHASLMFGNSCLGELAYEGTTAAIVMAGLFISFLIEFCVQRAMRWQASKKSDNEIAHMSPQAVAQAELANISIMEAGIIFHSLLIGLTLVVAGDSYFVTLAIVIIFHQMFEGIALGTRIAAVGYGTSTAALSMHSHMHSHGDMMPPVDKTGPSTVPLYKKLLLATGFALVTPIGMAIGIGVLDVFNGNDPSTIVAIGTLDALSAGILIWVGVVEMWAQDWLLGGELADANLLTTCLALFGLIAGMVLMSFLGKWA